MLVDDQHDVIDLLSRPDTYGTGVQAVSRVDTHISAVFLAGDRAYKLKRAVRFDYLDFSTAERRHAACEAEVRVNRRTAPDLYLGVCAIVRRGGILHLGGEGAPVDWVVEMRRFDDRQLFDRLATRGALTVDAMRNLATIIAEFHARAKPRRDHGGAAGMGWVVEGNIADLAAHRGRPFDADAVEALAAASRAALRAASGRLDVRRQRGMVRECHGDLHLRNICQYGDRPVLFDAIEFNDEISCIDVWYDLAFLLMDLLHRDLHAHANVVLNTYLGASGDEDGLPLLPLFLSCRASVRAKIGASAGDIQAEDAARAASNTEAAGYLQQAVALLAPAPPVVVAIGGLSGTGKSSVAQRLAPWLGPAPGAVVVRSDVVRKAMHGLTDETVTLPPAAYAAGISAEVYAHICARAAGIARLRHAVVADAVFLDASHRAAIEAAARSAGAPFVGLWLEAPASVVEPRLAARHADASDATIEVYHEQRMRAVEHLGWHRLDASGDLDATVALARVAVERALRQPS